MFRFYLFSFLLLVLVVASNQPKLNVESNTNEKSGWRWERRSEVAKREKENIDKLMNEKKENEQYSIE